MPEGEEEYRDHLLYQRLRIDISNLDTRDMELARSPEGRALAGMLEKPDPNLGEALELYIKDRSGELAGFGPMEKRNWLNDKRRVVRYLTDALGKERTVSTLTREDVRTFMASMEKRGLGPASIKGLSEIR